MMPSGGAEHQKGGAEALATTNLLKPYSTHLTFTPGTVCGISHFPQVAA
jgi:hypothetical protein